RNWNSKRPFCAGAPEASVLACVGWFHFGLCLRIIFGSRSNTLMPRQMATTTIRIKSAIKSATAGAKISKKEGEGKGLNSLFFLNKVVLNKVVAIVPAYVGRIGKLY